VVYVILGVLLAGLVLQVRERRQTRRARAEDERQLRVLCHELAEALNGQESAFAQVLEELGTWRGALAIAGVIERQAAPPPPPPPEEPPLPSTKPSQSRKVPAAPRSEPRLVPFEDQIQRAMGRIERHAKVPPEVQARWEQRLRALGDELGLPADDEPTDSQLARVVRELYEAEGDVKDARPAAPPFLEATLASAASPIAVRIAQVTTRPEDADGETTLRREGDRPAALPRPNADDESGDGHDTGEDMTKVFSKDPRAADAQIPGVEVKPATVRPPPHRPPRPLVDPLAGVEPERPTASATRTAEAFRKRTTLPGIAAAPKNDKAGET
jgi:hypothetical protein